MNTLKNKWYSFFFAKKLIPLLFVIASCLGLAAWLGSLVPSAISDLFETYNDEKLFFESVKMVLFIYIGEYFNRILYNFCTTVYVRDALLKTRQYCYGRWLSNYETQKSGKSKDEFSLGEILSRLMSDTDSVGELVNSGAFGMFIDFFFISSCLYGLIQIHPLSGMILTITEVLTVLGLIWGSRYMMQTFFKLRIERGVFSRIMSDVLRGTRENYYNDHGNFAQKKVKEQFKKFLKEQRRSIIFEGGYYSLAESLYPLFLVVVGLTFSYSPLVTGGIITAVIDLIQRSIDPVKDITGKIGSIQRAMSGIKRINEFIGHLHGGIQLGHLPTPSMDFDSLEVCVDEFSYHTRQGSTFSLNDIKFEGKKGELIGIVGLSGSGKSTLLKILSCDLLAEKGSITIKTKTNPIRFDFKQTDQLLHYRNKISLVSQDSHVFSASLAFNIAMELGREEEVEEFWSAVSKDIPYLQAWGVTPSSLLSPSSLSAGQKQLMSALRACFLKRPIALFDEISSSLDSSLEMALRRLVLLAQKHALTIIVAHRVETLIFSNQILVMDEGRLVASGDHSHLIVNCPLYADFIAHLGPREQKL